LFYLGFILYVWGVIDYRSWVRVFMRGFEDERVRFGKYVYVFWFYDRNI